MNRTLQVSDKRKLDSVKREAGEIPARTRRCERGALFQQNAVIGFSEKTKQSDDTQVRRPARGDIVEPRVTG